MSDYESKIKLAEEYGNKMTIEGAKKAIDILNEVLENDSSNIKGMELMAINKVNLAIFQTKKNDVDSLELSIFLIKEALSYTTDKALIDKINHEYATMENNLAVIYGNKLDIENLRKAILLLKHAISANPSNYSNEVFMKNLAIYEENINILQGKRTFNMSSGNTNMSNKGKLGGARNDGRYCDHYCMSRQQWQDWKDWKWQRWVIFIVVMIGGSIFTDRAIIYFFAILFMVADLYDKYMKEQQWLKDGSIRDCDL